MKSIDKSTALLYDFHMKERLVKKSFPFGRLAMITAGGLLVIDTLFVMTRSNLNLGVVMPAIIGFPLLAIGILLPLFKKACKKSKLFRALAFLLSLVYAVFALAFAFTSTLILVNSAEPSGEADALIVLGGGIRGDQPTITLRRRLERAAEYLEEHPSCVCIVSGGMGGDETVSEASVMRSWLVSHGIGEARILTEEESKSTEENFIFSKRIADRVLGEDAKLVFVTTRFHVFRAERTAARLGIEAEGIPAPGVWYITFNDYLRECAAITAYWLTGKI